MATDSRIANELWDVAAEKREVDYWKLWVWALACVAHLQCVCNQCSGTCKVSIVRNENCSVSSICCREMDRRTNVVAQFLDLLLPLVMKVKKTDESVNVFIIHCICLMSIVAMKKR